MKNNWIEIYNLQNMLLLLFFVLLHRLVVNIAVHNYVLIGFEFFWTYLIKVRSYKLTCICASVRRLCVFLETGSLVFLIFLHGDRSTWNLNCDGARFLKKKFFGHPGPNLGSNWPKKWLFCTILEIGSIDFFNFFSWKCPLIMETLWYYSKFVKKILGHPGPILA